MKLDTEIIYLLGNKDDLYEDREVSYTEAKKVLRLVIVMLWGFFF